jgi:hypothetical protein
MKKQTMKYYHLAAICCLLSLLLLVTVHTHAAVVPAGQVAFSGKVTGIEDAGDRYRVIIADGKRSLTLYVPAADPQRLIDQIDRCPARQTTVVYDPTTGEIVSVRCRHTRQGNY